MILFTILISSHEIVLTPSSIKNTFPIAFTYTFSFYYRIRQKMVLLLKYIISLYLMNYHSFAFHLLILVLIILHTSFIFFHKLTLFDNKKRPQTQTNLQSFSNNLFNNFFKIKAIIFI